MEVKLELKGFENVTLYVQNARSYLRNLVLGIEYMKLLVVNDSYFHCLKPRLMFGVSMCRHCLLTISANSRLCLQLKATFIKL